MNTSTISIEKDRNTTRHLCTAKKGLTVLSFGAGQHSTYILYRILLDPSFRERWVTGDFIVVMSDTGAEHRETYRHIMFIESLCAEHGIPFYFLKGTMGYHPRTWPSLTAQFQRNNTIMSMAYKRSCTDNLKIKPFYNFLDQYIRTVYYSETLTEPTPNLLVRLATKGFLPKYFIKKWVEDHGVRITVLLGIAAGEESRIAGQTTKEHQLALFDSQPAASKVPVWMGRCIAKVYPLIAERVDRSLAQVYIQSTPWPLPPPSNCVYCPYFSPIELLWLYRFHPDQYHHWVAMERAKIKRYRERGLPDNKNFGVKGTKLLAEQLADAIRLHGHLTNEELTAHKISRGHCVQSRY